jgi:phage antirepressor YoqD-like protein
MRRPWTPADDDRLHYLWGADRLEAIAADLGRTPVAVYLRARRIGLKCGTPQGSESFAEACRRTGFSPDGLRHVLRRAGVRLRQKMSPPGPRKTAVRGLCVDSFAVDEAVAKWLSEETPGEAARRHGVRPEALRSWLREAGKIPQSRSRRTCERIPSTEIDAVVAEVRRLRNVTSEAKRLGVPQQTLSRWLREAGVPRRGAWAWLVDPETVERVVSERMSRRRERTLPMAAE